MPMKKVMAFRIKDGDKIYIEDLAIALDRTESWVIQALIEYAIKHHKKGEFEI